MTILKVVTINFAHKTKGHFDIRGWKEVLSHIDADVYFLQECIPMSYKYNLAIRLHRMMRYYAIIDGNEAIISKHKIQDDSCIIVNGIKIYLDSVVLNGEIKKYCKDKSNKEYLIIGGTNTSKDEKCGELDKFKDVGLHVKESILDKTFNDKNSFLYIKDLIIIKKYTIFSKLSENKMVYAEVSID